jgi:hypothetical protein
MDSLFFSNNLSRVHSSAGRELILLAINLRNFLVLRLEWVSYGCAICYVNPWSFQQLAMISYGAIMVCAVPYLCVH